MSVELAYQQVIAGRVREDEQIGFFRDNKIATPARVTSFQSVGGKAQPTIEVNHLQHPGVGKPNTESDVLEVYVGNSYNLS